MRWEVESAYGFGVLLRDELRGLVLHSLLHRDMRVRSRQLREATAADDREEVGVALGVELLEALQGGGDGGVEVLLVRRGLRCAKHRQRSAYRKLGWCHKHSAEESRHHNSVRM